jgi:hypothetical protein
VPVQRKYRDENMMVDFINEGYKRAEMCRGCTALVRMGIPNNYCAADGKIAFLANMDINVIKKCVNSPGKTPETI